MAELRRSVGVKRETSYEQPFEGSKTKVDITFKEDDVFKKFKMWFHQKHGSIIIRHLYLGVVCTIREKLVKGEKVIVCVIESEEAIENEKFPFDEESLTVVYKRWGEITDSEETEKDQKHDYGEIKEIAKYLEEKENDMFQEHSNLEMVRASQYRMKTNKENKKETIYEPCIVIYCSYKGVVPVGENEFPATMDGYPTDIREGFFHLHLNYGTYANQNDLLDPLRMGASISVDGDRVGQGTLGGFVKLKNGGDGFITCAHVLHSDYEMQNPPSNTPRPVLQPSVYLEGSQQCGFILRSVFPSFTTVGRGNVDATVVELTERVPDRALFAGLMASRLRTLGLPRTPQFFIRGVRSKVEALHRFNERTLKCGMRTGLTQGILIGEGHSIYRGNVHGNLMPTRHISHMVILSTHGTPFSERGDSGSLVFQYRNIDDLRCIGMLIGGHGNYSYVTPIIPVLEALNVTLNTF